MTEPLAVDVPPPPGRHTLKAYGGAALVIAAVTAVGLPFRGRLTEIDTAMLYLAAVVVASMRHGRAASVLAAVLAVAAFDLGFVPPYGSFAVSDVRYLPTFAVMFAVAITLGHLTTRVREQADAARLRERRTSTLYALSRDLAAARSQPDVARVTLRHLHELFGGRVELLQPDASGRLQRIAELPAARGAVNEPAASPSRPAREEAGAGGRQAPPGAEPLFIPLPASQGTLGVIGVQPDHPSRFADPAQRQLLNALVGQAAVALERTQLAEEKRLVHLQFEAEQLRTSLLSSLSHDLRTPLAGIEGAASSLVAGGDRLPAPVQRELAQTIVDESRRMTRLVGNLLDMVRVETGALHLRRDWHVLEELVGSALQRLDAALTGREVTVHLESGLPLVPIDDVLVEQVLINLLENAARHTPPGSPIALSASTTEAGVEVCVADRGPGVAMADAERIFAKFERGSAVGGGVGLGLAICRGIVAAHGGRIWVTPREGGGAVFRFTLPVVGIPPAAAPVDPSG